MGDTELAQEAQALDRFLAERSQAPQWRADAEDFPADAMPVRVLALGLPHTQEGS
jgi:hypothetical protein